MGFLDTMLKTKLPDFKEISNSTKSVKSDIVNQKLNTVDVFIYDKNYVNVIKTTGEIKRNTSINELHISSPEKLVYLIDDNTIVNELTNGNRIVNIVDNHPFTLNFNKLDKAEIEVLGRKSEITAKYLYENSTIKLMYKVNKNKNDGAIILVFMGMLIGIIFGFGIMAYILG